MRAAAAVRKGRTRKGKRGQMETEDGADGSPDARSRISLRLGVNLRIFSIVIHGGE
jgi:hypothetical protein